jgi:hypothetical protein
VTGDPEAKKPTKQPYSFDPGSLVVERHPIHSHAVSEARDGDRG